MPGISRKAPAAPAAPVEVQQLEVVKSPHDWWWNKTHWRCRACLRISLTACSKHKLASDNAPCGAIVPSMRAMIGQGSSHKLYDVQVLGTPRVLIYCRACYHFCEKAAKKLAQPCDQRVRPRGGKPPLGERQVKNRRLLDAGKHPLDKGLLGEPWQLPLLEEEQLPRASAKAFCSLGGEELPQALQEASCPPGGGNLPALPPPPVDTFAGRPCRRIRRKCRLDAGRE